MAAELAESLVVDLPPWSEAPSYGEIDPCPACGHPESAHELLLTSTISCVICHEPTESGECFRVRDVAGIRFGACRRDPP